eukprot:GGOE01021081.1.p3 GENE.GGOE01021081.1~~GGOE01021081.1.p3  ORF type:complete len:143 (-),score=52.03 GGOE01021081.1:369-797(-)
MFGGFELSDSRKIGFGLTVGGLLFTALGVLLFFDGLLLTMGNILFLSGVTLAIGTRKAFSFFFQVAKWKATTCFFLGVVLVLLGRPFVGLCIQGFGFINLFGDFFPVALRFARSLPVIGAILRLPILAPVLDRLLNASRPAV